MDRLVGAEDQLGKPTLNTRPTATASTSKDQRQGSVQNGVSRFSATGYTNSIATGEEKGGEETEQGIGPDSCIVHDRRKTASFELG